MKERVKQLVAGFDAFPKVDVSYLNPTTSGGLTSLVAFTMIGLLAVSEVYRFFTVPVVNYSLQVDRELQSTINLTFDISIATPCEQLVVAVMDAGGQKEILNSQIRAELIHWRSSGLSAEGCRIKADLPLNKVTGELIILPNAGMMQGPFGQLLIFIDKRINFSHRIHRFSFGPGAESLGTEFYKERHFKNPLDGAQQPSLDRQERFTYKLSVIPTRFVSGNDRVKLSTNQYSVVGLKSRKDDPNVILPGLYFEYDLEPLAVTVKREYKSFLWFLVSVLGIIGGIYTCSGLIHHCVHHSYIYYISGKNAFRARHIGSLDQRLGSSLSSSKSLSLSPIRMADDDEHLPLLSKQ